MRKLIFICALLLSCACVASAQNNRAFKKGYEGSIELGNYAVFGKEKAGAMIQAATTHGYRFGNGMFFGVGIGLGYDFDSRGAVIPAFLDAKYNFVDAGVSPFISARTGLRVWEEGPEYGRQPFIAVAAGVDAGHLSVKLGYDYGDRYVEKVAAGQRISGFIKPSQLFCSFAFKF